MLPKENGGKKNDPIILFAVMFILLVFLMLNGLEATWNDPYAGIFEIVLSGFGHLSKPFELSHAFMYSDKVFKCIAVSAIAAFVISVYFHVEQQSKDHINSKIAKGSAQWNTDFKGFAKKYTLEPDKKHPNRADQNIILGQGIKKGLKEGDNTNVVVLGAAGSGKSFGIIKPNLMQMNTSFCITDPSGEIFQSEASMLLNNGYDVKIFSTSNMQHSNCYNPYDYVYDEDGNLDETRVTTMVNMFLTNAADMKNNKGDKFWDQSSRALLGAIAMFQLEFLPEEMHDMYHMLKLVQMGKTSERNSDAKTELDTWFDYAKKLNENAHCFSSYSTFKLAPAKTANSILISAAVDLDKFNQDKVHNMSSTDYKVASRNLQGEIRSYSLDRNRKLIRTDKNIDLRTIGDQKTAIFINIPQADTTYNFLVSMMYAQLFETLYGRAEKLCPNKYMIKDECGDPIISMIDSREDAEKLVHLYENASIVSKTDNSGKEEFYIENRDAKRFSDNRYYDGALKKVYSYNTGKEFLDRFNNCTIEQGKSRLPWHVQLLLDEFSNIGEIPRFANLLATSRKYELSAIIILQSKAQLDSRYDKLSSDILSNCDSTVFLGSSDPDTCKYISDRLGKTSTRVRNTSRSVSGKGGNSSASFNVDSRELATQDEVSRLDKDKAIILVAGEQPFCVPKYRAIDHPNWEISGDYDGDGKRSERRIHPDKFTTCTNKLLSKKGEAYAKANSFKNAVLGKGPDGEPIASQIDIYSREDLAKKTNTNPKDATGLKKQLFGNITANLFDVANDADNAVIPGSIRLPSKKIS